MGNTSVAVLHNDMTGEIKERGGEIGKRMAYAMNTWNSVTLDGNFCVGRIISRDHSSAHQVVVVYGNTGCHVVDAKEVSYLALSQMADCLKRHGWSAKPPPKKRRSSKLPSHSRQDASE